MHADHSYMTPIYYLQLSTPIDIKVYYIMKGHNSDDRYIEQNLRSLQAKPTHQKMQQVRKILCQNRQLTSMNISLYTCLQSLFNYYSKGKQTKQQTLSLFKFNKTFLETKKGEKGEQKFYALVAQIAKTVELGSAPTPTFSKANKIEISPVNNDCMKTKQTAKQSFTLSSKSSFNSTQSRGNSFSENSSEDEYEKSTIAAYNTWARQIIEENEQLKTKVKEFENAQSTFKDKMLDLHNKLQLASKGITKIKQQVDAIKICTSTTKSNFCDVVLLLKNQMQTNKHEFEKRLLEVQNKMERNISIKIYNQIMNMSYDWGYECMPHSLTQTTNSLALENVRVKIINDISLNRVKLLTQTLSMFKSTDLNQDKEIKCLPQQKKLWKEIIEQILVVKEQANKLSKRLNSLEKEKEKEKEKSEKAMTISSFLEINPALWFLMSNIVPVVGNENKMEQVRKTQQFIIDSLQKHYKKNRKICSLKYLYGYRQMCKMNSNFHCMVDNYPNLLLIIKLKNNVIIGSYSEQGLSETNSGNNRNKGFIFQCKTATIYEIRSKYQNKSVMPYDPYYILVGNHDIKIRMDSELIESCFGYETSLFRPSSEYTTDSLLFCGQDNTTTELLDYQFYQVNLS